jgi:hypothetical protein
MTSTHTKKKHQPSDPWQTKRFVCHQTPRSHRWTTGNTEPTSENPKNTPSTFGCENARVASDERAKTTDAAEMWSTVGASGGKRRDSTTHRRGSFESTAWVTTKTTDDGGRRNKYYATNRGTGAYLDDDDDDDDDDEVRVHEWMNAKKMNGFLVMTHTRVDDAMMRETIQRANRIE